MLINGKCHCGNIVFSLEWPEASAEIPARACTCSFCVKHGGVWASNPGASLVAHVHDAALMSKYTFGTETANFHVCVRCGAVPFVSCAIDEQLYAVVNVNTFEGVDPACLRRSESNVDGEGVESRLARRKRNWIGNVQVVEGKS